MITVMETWHLKPRYMEESLVTMQEMDCLLGPIAHSHPGWCDHAKFYQDTHNPLRIIMIYKWKSRHLHEDLIDKENSNVAKFTDQYCSANREILYFDEIPVDV